jgi:hypothetical protein
MKIVIFHSYVSLPEGKLILIHIKPVGAGETFPGISSTYWISNGDVCNLYSKILTPQGNSVPLIASHGYFKLPELVRGTQKTPEIAVKSMVFCVFLSLQ